MTLTTRTFSTALSLITTNVVTELVHFRDIALTADETTAIYLEACFCNVSLKSFQLMRFPDYEGDESEAERLAMFTDAELKSQKVGLRILSRKNNTGTWREKAEIILTNAGRKSYFDLLIPYLAKAQVRLLEYNDALGIQLIDYGNGLLKLTDFVEIEMACTVDISKKNADFEQLSARIASLELALENKLINVPANTLLGRNTTAGTVQSIPQNTFAKPSDIDAAILGLINAAPTALNTLDELARALGNDQNFATTITNQLALKTNNSFPSSTLAEYSISVSTALNIPVNTWYTVGIFNNLGVSSIESVFICSVYIQYGDGTNTYGHWQYHGACIITSIQWKAGGSQLSTNCRIEAHNGADFNCSVRFASGNVNRQIQLLFDIPMITLSPSLLRVKLKRIF